MELQNNYENVELESDVGFDVRFVTMHHNSPHHWHREMEILYILNGHATVNMDGERYELEPLEAIVIDYSKIHEVLYALPQTMGICIHISRNLLGRFLPGQELMTFRCSKKYLSEEQTEAYERMCAMLKKLTVLYVNQQRTYRLRSNSMILEILADLIEYFSEPVIPDTGYVRLSNVERLEQVCDYVEHHYKEEINLQDAADELGLNREYFCRFLEESKENFANGRFVRKLSILNIGEKLQANLLKVFRVTLLTAKWVYSMMKSFYILQKIWRSFVWITKTVTLPTHEWRK